LESYQQHFFPINFSTVSSVQHHGKCSFSPHSSVKHNQSKDKFKKCQLTALTDAIPFNNLLTVGLSLMV